MLIDRHTQHISDKRISKRKAVFARFADQSNSHNRNAEEKKRNFRQCTDGRYLLAHKANSKTQGTKSAIAISVSLCVDFSAAAYCQKQISRHGDLIDLSNLIIFIGNTNKTI